MGNRTIRTREQRIADTERELAKLKQGTIDQAIHLRKQAEAWAERSKELVVKALSASDKADALLVSLGIDAEVFWKEHDAKAGE